MYNFSKIKETYNKVYLDSFSSKNKEKKKLFEYYLSTIKNSKILKEEFNCYSAIQNTSFENELDSQMFIQENINIVKNINKTELKNIHKKLIEKLSENGTSLIESSNDKIILFESLLKTEKNSKNLNKITETITKLRKTLVKEGFDEKSELDYIALPTNVLSNMLVNKFNSKYSELDETTKTLIKVSLHGSEDEKSKLFNSTLKECLELINNRLKESVNDMELKDKLLQTKERLLEMSFNKDTYFEHLAKLVDLKDDL